MNSLVLSKGKTTLDAQARPNEISVERDVSYLGFKVRFGVVPTSNSGFVVNATVIRDGQAYPQVNIKNLPKLDGLKTQEEVIELLKKRAIDCIGGDIFFLPSDPLETFRSWENQAKGETDSRKKVEIGIRIQKMREIVSTITGEMKKIPLPDLGQKYILLGDGYCQLQHYLDAALCYQNGYLAARGFKNLGAMGNAQGSLGVVYEKMGDLQRALNFHEKHMGIARYFQNEELIAMIHINMATTCGGLGDKQREENHLAEAKKYFEETKNTNQLIKIYNNFGYKHDAEGEFTKAIAMYQKVIALTKDSGALGDAYTNLGSAHNSQGNYNQAIDSFNAAERHYRKAGIRSAAPYGGLGNVYQNLGNYLKSIQNHRLALGIYQIKNEESGEGVVCCNLANAYDALSVRGTVSDVLPEDKITFSTEQALRQYYRGQAVALYEKARQIAQRSGQSVQLTTPTINLASIHYVDGNLSKALSYCLEILPICRETQDYPGLAAAYKMLAQICIDMGELRKAETYFLESLEIYERAGMQLEWGRGHTKLGNFYRVQKRYSEAESLLRKAIAVFSNMQNQITASNIQHSISFFETIFLPYRLLEMTCLKQLNSNASMKDHGEIIAISDSGRARALVSILNKKLGIEHSTPITFDQIKSFTSRLRTTLVIYSCDQLKKNNGWCWVVSPEGKIVFRNLDLTAIVKEVEFKSERPSYLRGSKAFKDDLDRSSGGGMTTNINAALSDYPTADNSDVRGNPGDGSTAPKEHVTKIWYQNLVKPIADLLPREEGSRVTIVPDSTIHQLPFAIFSDEENKALIDKFTLITIPSVETLLKIEQLEQKQQGRRQRTKACIVANPDDSLKGADEEGLYAKELFQEPIFLPKDKATKAAVTAALPSVGYIHLACHGAVADAQGNPVKKNMDSVFQGALDLAGDQLFADDLIDIPINVDFAILNACESGKGYLCKEGIVGLSHALLGAGASTVIATKWTVPDRQACEVIQSFYQYYFGKAGGSTSANSGSLAKAEALRKAVLDMKKKYPANLKAWGGFFLIGLPD